MSETSIFQALKQTNEYQKMQPKDRVQLRKRRLYELVCYARDNSPLYRELYANLKENFTIKDIPITDKNLLVDSYNEWVTDREVSYASMCEHVTNSSHEELYLGKYHAVTSSGMQGDPLIYLFDKEAAGIMSVNHIKRCFARREYFWRFLMKGGRLANIYSGNDYIFHNVFADMRRTLIPTREKRSINLSVQSSTRSLVSALNEFQPAMLAGFPSALNRLADERLAGRLKISPVCIMADGEPLDDELRQKISSAFGCDVTSSYSTAVTGCIAYECREHHLHINDDYIILEPINANNEQVPAGFASDKVLVTNLLSHAQPIIRYELGDRVTVHDEGCLCGNKSPWIEIDGRTLDQIRFVDGMKEVVVPLSDLDDVLKHEDYIKRYQIIVHPNNHLELRLNGANGTDKTMAFFKAEKLLRAYMRSIGILAPMITLEKEDPKPHPISGKYQTIIIE